MGAFRLLEQPQREANCDFDWMNTSVRPRIGSDPRHVRRNTMPGDYTKLSFKPRQDHSAVFMQQGKVQLDADWNHMVEMFARRFPGRNG